MKMSELIRSIGDDNVAFQNLDQSMISLDYKAKTGTTITFGTSEPSTLDGTSRLGLVLWLDREAVKRALADFKARAALNPETPANG